MGAMGGRALSPMSPNVFSPRPLQYGVANIGRVYYTDLLLVIEIKAAFCSLKYRIETFVASIKFI
mgnify:CR=1 FL=1